MSKTVIWVVAIIAMIMTTGVLASAAANKGEAQNTEVFSGSDGGTEAQNIATSEATNKGTASPVNNFADKVVVNNNEAGREYLIRAWGRYGPINLATGYNTYRRIYFPGSFLGSPVVVDSLNVAFPYNSGTIYALGNDKGYTTATRFDARIAVHSGNPLSGAYVDWAAIRG